MKEEITNLLSKIDLTQLRAVDHALAASLRNSELSGELWLAGENIALNTLVLIEDKIYKFDADDVDGIIEEPINLCGYILWSAAQRKQQNGIKNSDLTLVDDACYLAIKAIIAFLYCANIANANSINKNIREWSVSNKSYELFMDIVESICSLKVKEHSYSSSVQLITYYKNAMDSDTSDYLNLVELMQEDLREISDGVSSNSVSSLCYSFQTITRWLTELLASRVIRKYLPDNRSSIRYITSIKKHGPFYLFPSQRIAFNKLHSSSLDTNLLITYPTSTGKTFLGEVFGLQPILEDIEGITVLLVPLRALVTQNRLNEKLRNRLEGTGVKFISAMGGYMNEIEDLEEITSPIFIVATLEAFDYIWRTKSHVRKNTKSVIIDEFQLIEQTGRGILLECMCANFMDYKLHGSLKRIVLLSAVVDQTKHLQEWLDISEDNVLHTFWKATKTRFEIQTNDYVAEYIIDDNSTTKKHVLDRWDSSSGVQQQASKKNRKKRNQNTEKIHHATAHLAINTFRKLNGTTLVVCNSRTTTRLIAMHAILILRGKNESELQITRVVQELLDLIDVKYPEFSFLKTSIRYGICFHNSELPYQVREKLEDIIDTGYFKVVASTTTLAEGVNLPFRAVILENWTWSDADKGKPFKPLLVRNIIGRAGRAGYHVEGDAIFADNIRARRISNPLEVLQSALQSKDVELVSSLISVDLDIYGQYLLEPNNNYDKWRLAESIKTRATTQSCLASYISQKNLENPVDDFISRLYVFDLDRNKSQILENQLANYLEKQLDESTKNKLLTRNSPVRLTTLGELANETGLALESCGLILDFLQDPSLPSKPSRSSKLIKQFNLYWSPILDACFHSLRNTLELQSSWLKDGEKYGSIIKNDTLFLFMTAWCSGWSYSSIIWLLKYRKGNQSAKWKWPIDDLTSDINLISDLLSVQQFCASWFSYQWHWILSGATRLASSENSTIIEDLQNLASKLRYGVSSELAVSIIVEEDFPGNRTHAQIISQLILQARGIETTTINELFELENLPTREDLLTISLDQDGYSRIDPQTAQIIADWFRQRNIPF